MYAKFHICANTSKRERESKWTFILLDKYRNEYYTEGILSCMLVHEVHIKMSFLIKNENFIKNV